MSSVDPLFAQWLQSDADRIVRTDAAAAARWGATAVSSERVTGIATRADAQVEGDRQLAFFARGPFVEDVHQLIGIDWTREIGRIVTLTVDQLGYDRGIDVLVLDVEADRSTGISQVAVLRPMRGV